MRNMQERMEEIHRRSEICIAKRKRRQKMLVSLASSGLCVCLCLGAVFLVGNRGAGEDRLTGEAEYATQAALDTMGAPAGNIAAGMPEEVPDGMPLPENAGPPLDNGTDEPLFGASALRGLEVMHGEVASYTVEPAVLSRTEAMLSGLQFTCRAQGGSGVPEDRHADCTFALVYRDGSRTEYRLTDSLLENAQTGDFVHLSQEQLTQLRTLLGLQ